MTSSGDALDWDGVSDEFGETGDGVNDDGEFAFGFGKDRFLANLEGFFNGVGDSPLFPQIPGVLGLVDAFPFSRSLTFEDCERSIFGTVLPPFDDLPARFEMRNENPLEYFIHLVHNCDPELCLDIAYDCVGMRTPFYLSPSFEAEELELAAQNLPRKHKQKAHALLARARQLRCLPRIYTRTKVNPRVSWEEFNSRLTDDDFQRLLRMDRASFEALLELISNQKTMNRDASKSLREDTVPCCKRTILACTLMRLGGSLPQDIALHLGLHRSTVDKAFYDGVAAVVSLSHRFIDTDPFGSDKKMDELARAFNSRTYKFDDPDTPKTMQGCVGALDGIVVKVCKPGVENSARFHNRKGYTALVFQALCDADSIFTFVSDAFVGSSSDNGCFSQTSLYGWIYGNEILGIQRKLKEDYWIAADAAYTCTDSVITPYTSAQPGKNHLSFNEKLNSLRVRIEMAFGILTSRFRIISHGLPTPVPQRQRDIFHAACCLHNFMRRRSSARMKRVQLTATMNPLDYTTLSLSFQSVFAWDEHGLSALHVDLGGDREMNQEWYGTSRANRRRQLMEELSAVWCFDPALERKRALEENERKRKNIGARAVARASQKRVRTQSTTKQLSCEDSS